MDINPNLTPTASLLEALYTALALFGVSVMVYTALDNWRDLRAVRRRRSDRIGEWIAKLGIREAIAGAMCHSVFLILGALSLVTPPPGPRLRLASALYSLGFIVIQAIIITVRSANQLDRMRIRRRLQRELG